MTRINSPIYLSTIAASAVGLLASLLIATTPVIHGGIPLAVYAGGIMAALIAAGFAGHRRQLAQAAARAAHAG